MRSHIIKSGIAVTNPTLMFRLIAVTCIAISGLVLTASYLEKRAATASEKRINSTEDETNAPGQTIIWQSLSRHLLTYN